MLSPGCAGYQKKAPSLGRGGFGNKTHAALTYSASRGLLKGCNPSDSSRTPEGAGKHLHSMGETLILQGLASDYAAVNVAGGIVGGNAGKIMSA